MNYKFIRQLTLKPKIIFLIDSLGALVTAFFLFAILRTFNEYVGMPQITLTYLSLIAVIFCLYSTTCFFLLKDNWRPFLRIISIANLLYCFLTTGLVISYHQNLTGIGMAYFVGEIIVVSGLIFVELKTLKASEQKNE
jgi:hypothetical protein